MRHPMLLKCLLPLFCLQAAGAAAGQPPAPDPQGLITEKHLDAARQWLMTEIVKLSVEAHNARYGALDAAEVTALDEQWKAERESDDKPLISATLSSPLSTYLLREQANSVGLYAAIFVFDANGLNVGQSAITSDFWQGDEAKFAETFTKGVGTVFIDEPEWVEEHGIWIAQVSMTIADVEGEKPIGAATIDFNLSELMRRKAVSANF